MSSVRSGCSVGNFATASCWRTQRRAMRGGGSQRCGAGAPCLRRVEERWSGAQGGRKPPFVWVSFASAQPPGYPLSRGGQAREGTRAERSSEGRTIHRRNSRTHLQLRQKSCATIHVGGLREEVLLELLQHRLRLFDAHGCCARPRSALRARLSGQQTRPELQSQRRVHGPLDLYRICP
jgi:hypothetical protein